LVNVRAAIDAIEDLQAAGILPIFASTDFVFDGRQGSYADDAPRTPVVTYGRQKAAVEAYCVASPKPSLVLRFSKVVGSSSASHNLIGEWLRAMEVGQTVRCAHDQRISPVGVEDLVIGIRKAAERGLTGVYNAGGPHGYSRLELVQVLSRKLLARGHTAPLVEPCSIRDFQFAEPRPLDTSLDSSALYRALEYRFRDMETYCEEVARLYTLNALSQPGVARDPSNEP
jgi:dTDP-4-dehydrorhamnose reductase